MYSIYKVLDYVYSRAHGRSSSNWIQTTSRSGLAQCAFNSDRFNAHSVWTQPMRIECAFDVQCGQAFSLWQATHDNPPPSHPSSHRQRVWDFAIVEASFNALIVSAPNTQSRARLLAVSCPESGAWLHAMPISSVGLRIDDDVRIAVSVRLGVPLCHPHMCSCCGTEVNNLGTYGLSCRFSKGRHSRHAALTTLSNVPWFLPRSLAIWSHLVFIDQMVSVRMVRRWFNGGVAIF